MKASTFIQVALIDQMQQIADLGLWFHLETLISKGVQTINSIGYGILPNHMFTTYDKLPGIDISWVASSSEINRNDIILLSSEAEKALHKTYTSDGRYQIHVPLFFEDFKVCAQIAILTLKARPDLDIEFVRDGKDK